MYRRVGRPRVEVSARIVTLELAETFVISRSARDERGRRRGELRHGGVTGYGEAAPIERYGESAESAPAYVEEHAELLGDDPFALEEIGRGCPQREFAARAALDAALHDLRASCSASPSGGCSGCAAAGRRRAGRSGSAIPTTWRAAPRRRAAASAG